MRVLGRSDLSSEIRRQVRHLQTREPRRNIRLATFIAMWAAGSACALLTHSWLVDALAVIVSAAALIGLSVFMHEACHRLLFRNRKVNLGIGFLCGLPVLISASAYRALHLKHHAAERTAADPDDIETLARKGRPLVLVYYALLLTGTYLYLPHVALIGYRVARGRDRAIIVLEYCAIIGVHAAIWCLLPASTMLTVWVLPMLLASQVTNVRSLAEHGLTTSGSPFTATRSVISNRVVAFVFCNLNYHLEHHLFPAVPWYNLPALHQVLQSAYGDAGSSVYRSYTSFLIDFVRTTWSGIIPNVRLLPAHLLEEVCG